MKQYCRYCTYLVTGNGIYCEALDKEIMESTAKSTNHCKSFEFNPMDAFAEKPSGYKPRIKREILYTIDYEYCGNLTNDLGHMNRRNENADNRNLSGNGSYGVDNQMHGTP